MDQVRELQREGRVRLWGIQRMGSRLPSSSQER